MSDKIKKVTRTKVPTLKQIHNMCTNLHYKFNQSISIDIGSWHMSHNTEPSSEYVLYLSNETPGHTYFNTWPELQDKYFELMES